MKTERPKASKTDPCAVTSPDAPRHSRRGTAVVWTAVSLFTILGFCALAIDSGHMYLTRAELQNAADAAAMAAAAGLAGDALNYQNAAHDAAQRWGGQNPVYSDAMNIALSDLEFGRAMLDGTRYVFVPGGNVPDAVRVTVNKTDQSANGALPLFFAPLLGKDKKDLYAKAAAMLIPRDIALVADLSASHTDDSELAHYQMTEINLWDVWSAMPGGTPIEDPDASDQNAGPLYGFFEQLGWGDMTIDAGYNPAGDPGLVYLPKNTNWSNAQMTSMLSVQNYSSQEISLIMAKNGTGDQNWENRTAVALGLATWRSGLPGGKWQNDGLGAGDNDSNIENNEIQWHPYPHMNGSWEDYINNYMNKTWTEMYQANTQFRYRFGAKTFMNYLLERQRSHDETPELANAPVQPMQAVKEAVTELTAMIADLDSDDRLSLEVYDNFGHHEIDLTDQYHLVSQRLNEMQAGHYGSFTNMGDGIAKAIAELTGPRARQNAVKVIFLLTDGKPNVDQNGNVGNEAGGEAFARSMAEAAVAQGISIYSVTVGADTNRELMQDMAEMGDGDEFHAEGSIDQYSEQLRDIFRRLGGARPVVLIE